MGKEDGVVAVTVIRTVMDEDIEVVMDYVVMVETKIIFDHMMAKLMYIHKYNKATTLC